MKKNDKVIAIIGVLILVVASIGIYTWKDQETTVSASNIDDFFYVSGSLSNAPNAVVVSDSDPFYTLIATPLTVHYDEDGDKEIIPLYIQNFSNPSRSVERAIQQIGKNVNEFVDHTMSAEEWSLEIAKKHWAKSDAVLLIENNESAYNLGVIATPLASYLSIPVIITDELNPEVREVLSKLGVEKTLVCGKNIEGYGSVLKFENVDQIVDATIKLLMQKFGNIDYITLTNPIDAWPPEVLDSKVHYFGPTVVPSTASTQLIQYAMGGPKFIEGWSFTIPKDYKYALVKFEGINLDSDDVEELGDSVSFQAGPNLPDLPAGLQEYELFVGGTAAGGVPLRDESGKLTTDRLCAETVLYDRGGVEYNIKAHGEWLAKKEGEISAKVVIEKLEDPVYPMMKGLSSLAPYLTAYHKGIVFGKPEFAFTADDDVLTKRGKTCPGFYVPRRNPILTEISNEHVFDKIHDPLNNLLAKLANIDITIEQNLEGLREYYSKNPVYIALVGGATVLPQYIFQNYVEPADVEETHYYVGGGTPSDVIYGNIDPVKYDWENLAGDMYTHPYPMQENLVGRITGWDTQDASALIARTVFYNEIIDRLGDWKDNFGILIGAGQDFQKPLFRYLIFGDLLGLTPRGEPMKYPTGYGVISGKRTEEEVAKPMEFNLYPAYNEKAMRQGFSGDSINRLKKVTLLNRFFFHKRQVNKLVGKGAVEGGEIMEKSNFIWANAHGNQHGFGMAGVDLTAAGLGGRVVHRVLKKILPIYMGGFLGPGSSLGALGDYYTRGVENMEFGPSFMWLESCICGKIDGMYPQMNVGQALLHAGVTSLIASPTGSNIAGGYLEPKNRMYDTPFSVLRSRINANNDAKQGIYPEPHFGYKIFTDLCEDLKKNNVSIGMAFRNAKNRYLPEDADWELWWSPPLVITGNPSLDIEMRNNYIERMKSTVGGGKGPMLENKYTSYQEYLLFGDPAFNPYEPINEGR
ncbi:MAG: hypothetical protein JSW60_01285 [Thermoplasmatales archaeon]|nr:MAG: hypothetical protein JSW60_01285 [Thermoplasmatales archaeon]